MDDAGDRTQVGIVFMDVEGFSNESSPRQRQIIEDLNQGIDRVVLDAGITQLLARLPTGDGAILLARESPAGADCRLLRVASELARWESNSRRLRIGVHHGTVMPTILGITGDPNYCGSAINESQRIADIAGYRTPIACSKDFVDSIPANDLSQLKTQFRPICFGPVHQAEVKHGKILPIQFCHEGEVAQTEEISGKLAAFEWKLEKLQEGGGVDFYAFAAERTKDDVETLHKQLVAKNFERATPPNEILADGEFGNRRLDYFPVKTSEDGQHEHTSISGPGLDYGDLCYGNYAATFYYSVSGGSNDSKLFLEVRYSTSRHLFADKELGSLVFSVSEAIASQGQKGWTEAAIEFAYAGEWGIQFRLRLEGTGHNVPIVWFYKVHLERVGPLPQ